MISCESPALRIPANANTSLFVPTPVADVLAASIECALALYPFRLAAEVSVVSAAPESCMLVPETRFSRTPAFAAAIFTPVHRLTVAVSPAAFRVALELNALVSAVCIPSRD